MGDIGGIGAKSAARTSGRQRRSIVAQVQRLGEPDVLHKGFAYRMPAALQAQEPERRAAADALAVGEQQGLQASDIQAARRGLSGSGVHLARRAGIKSARQAGLDESLVQYYLKALENAFGEALQTQTSTMGAVAGVPQAQVGPSAGAVAANTGMNALSLYLMSMSGGKGGEAIAASPASRNTSAYPYHWGTP